MRTELYRGVALVGALAVVLAVGISTRVNAANIAWVSFHPADDMPSTTPDATSYGTMAPDVGYTQLLTSAGHTVTRFVTVNDVHTTTLASQLNAFDVVIIGRSVDSGHYQVDAETAVWNEQITKPMILMAGYPLRGSRLGFYDAETIPDTGGAGNPTGVIKLQAESPGHPIFAGIALDGTNTMVNDFTTGIQNHPLLATAQRGISVPTTAIDSDAVVLARINTAGDAAQNGIIIAEFAAGATIANDTTPDASDVLGGRRLIFLSGSREQSSGANASWAGILDLTPDGEQLFRNAVAYMAGPGLTPGDVDGDGDADINDFTVIRNNFQKTVTGRTFGDLTGDLKVNWLDFRQWKTAFGGPAIPGGEAIPEPASIGLGLAAALALIGASRSVRRCA